MIFGDKAFGKLLDLDEVMRVRPSLWDQCSYTERHQKACSLSSLCHVRTQNVAICKPGREPLTRTWPHWHPDLRCPVSKKVKTRFCCVSHPVYNILQWQLKLTTHKFPSIIETFGPLQLLPNFSHITRHFLRKFHPLFLTYTS